MVTAEGFAAGERARAPLQAVREPVGDGFRGAEVVTISSLRHRASRGLTGAKAP